jgi:hypothetical protein
MDYTSSFLRHTYRYHRINSKTGEVTAVVEGITPGGSIEYNDLTSIKVSGSVPFIDSLDLGTDYLRVWIDTEDGSGATESLALGTFLINSTGSTYRPAGKESTADLMSLLQVLSDSGLRSPLEVPEGTPCVAYAASVVRDVGLSVIAEPSVAALSITKVFDAGVSRLEVVNTLLQVAGFDSAEIDGFGTVRMRPLADLAGSNPVVTLDDGVGAILLPEIGYEMDLQNVPNVVIATMSNNSRDLIAVAENTDPRNRYSIPSRGREIVETVDVSDIDSLDALRAYANTVLVNKTSAVESITIRHAFVPYAAGDTLRVSVVVGIDFEGNVRFSLPERLDFVGSVAKREVTLDGGATVTSRIRRFVRL